MTNTTTSQAAQQVSLTTYTMRPSEVADLFPVHEVCDSQKVQDLASDMISYGWSGAPLVQHGGQLLNGTHRQAAVSVVGTDHYDFEAGIVDLLDVFDLDIDLVDNLVADGNLVELTYLCSDIDPAMSEYLGLDCH